jgi:hypothetical protein
LASPVRSATIISPARLVRLVRLVLVRLDGFAMCVVK